MLVSSHSQDSDVCFPIASIADRLTQQDQVSHVCVAESIDTDAALQVITTQAALILAVCVTSLLKAAFESIL